MERLFSGPRYRSFSGFTKFASFLSKSQNSQISESVSVSGTGLPLGASFFGSALPFLFGFYKIRKFSVQVPKFANFRIRIGIWHRAASWSVFFRVRASVPLWVLQNSQVFCPSCRIRKFHNPCRYLAQSRLLERLFSGPRFRSFMGFTKFASFLSKLQNSQISQSVSVSGTEPPLGASFFGSALPFLYRFYKIHKFSVQAAEFANFRIRVGIWHTAASWSVFFRVCASVPLWVLQNSQVFCPSAKFAHFRIRIGIGHSLGGKCGGGIN